MIINYHICYILSRSGTDANTCSEQRDVPPDRVRFSKFVVLVSFVFAALALSFVEVVMNYHIC